MVIEGYFKDGLMYKIYRINKKGPWKISHHESYPIENKELVKVMTNGFVDFEIVDLNVGDMIFNEKGAWSFAANPIFPFEQIK